MKAIFENLVTCTLHTQYSLVALPFTIMRWIYENCDKIVFLTILLICFLCRPSEKGGLLCDFIFQDGQYINDTHWQPNACQIHYYTNQDITECLKIRAAQGQGTVLTLVGDSRLRFLYDHFVTKIDPARKRKKIQEDGFFEKKSLKLTTRFFWKTMPNDDLYNMIQYLKEESPPSHLLVLGFGLWPLKLYKCNETVNEDYRKNLTHFQDILDELSDKMEVMWYTQPPGNPNAGKYICKMQDSVLIYFNDVARQSFRRKRMHFWSSSTSIAARKLKFYADAVHPGKIINENYLQILLNFFCNKHNSTRGKNTCCDPYSEFFIQYYLNIGILFSGLVSAVLAAKLLSFMKDWQTQKIQLGAENASEKEPTHLQAETDQFASPQRNDIQNVFPPTGTNIAFGMLKLSCIVMFIAAVQRSEIFVTQRKIFEEAGLLPCLIVFAILVIATIQPTRRKESRTELGDEVTGGILLIIIIWNAIGLPTTGIMAAVNDLMVSALLWTSVSEVMVQNVMEDPTNNIPLFQVLLRLNFLNIILGLAMTQRSLVSLLPLLISIWQATITGVMALPPRTRKTETEMPQVSYPILLLKSFFLACFMQFLPVAMHSLSDLMPSRELIVSFIELWEFHRFSAIWTIIFVLVGHWKNEKEKSILRTLLSSASGLILIFVWIVSVSIRSTNLQFTLWIPIVGFNIIRSQVPLQGFRSAFLSWTGLMWLELLLCQTFLFSGHEDNRSIIFLPFWTHLNRLIAIFICFTISSELRNINKLIHALVFGQNLIPLQKIFLPLLFAFLSFLFFFYTI